MTNILAILTQLRSERERLNQAIAALEGISSNGGSSRPSKRVLSAKARRRIAAAQKKRWAKWKKQHSN
jgi:hypothetical protein